MRLLSWTLGLVRRALSNFSWTFSSAPGPSEANQAPPSEPEEGKLGRFTMAGLLFPEAGGRTHIVGRHDGEMHLTVTSDGQVATRIFDLDASYHLAFGFDDTSPYFRVLSQNKPLVNGEPFVLPPDGRYYFRLAGEDTYEYYVTFPEFPGLQIYIELQSYTSWQMFWRVYARKSRTA